MELKLNKMKRGRVHKKEPTRPKAQQTIEGIQCSECSHDLEGRCFSFRVNRAVCYLSYEIRDGLVMDIIHTFVPQKHRGKGLAIRLCDAAYNYAESKGLRVIPSCSFVREKYHSQRQVSVAAPESKVTSVIGESRLDPPPSLSASDAIS